MKIKTLFSLLVLTPFSIGAQLSRPSAAVYTTLVDPNVLISRDGVSRFFEPFIAADPKDPQRLIVSAVSRVLQAGQRSRAFWSGDGGNSWTEAILPQHSAGADAYVAFGSHGAAYLSTLSVFYDSTGRQLWPLDVYRSENRGETWVGPVHLTAGYNDFDYEKIAVDVNPNLGRDHVYVITKAQNRAAKLTGSLLFRSDDGARTFRVTIAHQDRINAFSLLVQRDGQIFIPFKNDNVKGEDIRKPRILLLKSGDGGKTFSRPIVIAAQDFHCLNRATRQPEQLSISSESVLGLDRSGSAYSNSLYAAWTDCRFGKSRIVFSRSSDGGTTWSAVRAIDAQAPDSSSQFLPAIAVNDEGLVGVSWLDTRHSSDGNQFDTYFASSVDGGKSFLPSVRVSSSSSNPYTPANLPLDVYDFSQTKNGINAILNSIYVHRRNGEDYLGLTGDAAGSFHFVWVDSRTGSAQLWTSRIRVIPNGGLSAARATSGVVTDVTGKLMLQIDASTYDPATKEQVLWARLRNVSPDTSCAPIVLRVTPGPTYAVGSGGLTNADSGSKVAGLTFDYTRALRDLHWLPPQGVTEPIPLRAVGMSLTFNARITATSCGITSGISPTGSRKALQR